MRRSTNVFSRLLFRFLSSGLNHIPFLRYNDNAYSLAMLSFPFYFCPFLSSHLCRFLLILHLKQINVQHTQKPIPNSNLHPRIHLKRKAFLFSPLHLDLSPHLRLLFFFSLLLSFFVSLSAGSILDFCYFCSSYSFPLKYVSF